MIDTELNGTWQFIREILIRRTEMVFTVLTNENFLEPE